MIEIFYFAKIGNTNNLFHQKVLEINWNIFENHINELLTIYEKAEDLEFMIDDDGVIFHKKGLGFSIEGDGRGTLKEFVLEILKNKLESWIVDPITKKTMLSTKEQLVFHEKTYDLYYLYSEVINNEEISIICFEEPAVVKIDDKDIKIDDGNKKLLEIDSVLEKLGFSLKLRNILVLGGYSSIDSIIKSNVSEIAKLKGFGKIKANKLIKELNNLTD